MGIRGEPSTPDDPSRGLVWSAIVAQIDQPGSQSDFVSVGDSPREVFHKHPWSIGGGGAAELKEQLDEIAANTTVGRCRLESGSWRSRGEDDVFVATAASSSRRVHRRRRQIRPMIDRRCMSAIGSHDGFSTMRPFRYDARHCELIRLSDADGYLWPLRTSLWRTGCMFGKTTIESMVSRGSSTMQFIRERVRTPLSIVFGEVATHNHFVLDRGGKVFKQYGPGHQAASRGHRRRSPRAAWSAQQLHRLFLDEAGMSRPKGGVGSAGGIASRNGKAQAYRMQFQRHQAWPVACPRVWPSRTTPPMLVRS